MSSAYCPNCGKNQPEGQVVKCTSCGQKYCNDYNCNKNGCPKCGGHGVTICTWNSITKSWN